MIEKSFNMIQKLENCRIFYWLTVSLLLLQFCLYGISNTASVCCTVTWSERKTKESLLGTLTSVKLELLLVFKWFCSNMSKLHHEKTSETLYPDVENGINPQSCLSDSSCWISCYLQRREELFFCNPDLCAFLLFSGNLLMVPDNWMYQLSRHVSSV